MKTVKLSRTQWAVKFDNAPGVIGFGFTFTGNGNLFQRRMSTRGVYVYARYSAMHADGTTTEETIVSETEVGRARVWREADPIGRNGMDRLRVRALVAEFIEARGLV